MLHHDSQLEHLFIKRSWLNCQSIILIWSVSSVSGSFHLYSNTDQSWFISVHPQIRMTFSVLWNVVFPVYFLTLVKRCFVNVSFLLFCCHTLWSAVCTAVNWYFPGVYWGPKKRHHRGMVVPVQQCTAMLVQRGMCLAQSTACLSWYFSHYIWWSHTHINLPKSCFVHLSTFILRLLWSYRQKIWWVWSQLWC